MGVLILEHNKMIHMQITVQLIHLEIFFLVGYAKDPSSPIPLTTTGAHQETYGGGTYDSFLAKFDSTGNLSWSTYYGGSNRDRFTSCSLDQNGNLNAPSFIKVK